MMEDLRLLREYAEQGSERAFTLLVERHLGLVYSAALRRLGDRQAAEDVTQSVFSLLARKAGRLSSSVVLAGWLHRAVCLAAAKYWRTEFRRRRHEQEAMIPETSTSEATWDELAPHLDEALNRLSNDDRVAVLLRFFQSKPFQEVGQTLGISEDAARMRINRALERLRLILQHKKVACTPAALGTLLAAHSISAVPQALLGTVGANALRATAAAGGGSFVAGFLAWMAREKLKTAVVVATVAVTGSMVLRFLQPPQRSPIDQRTSNDVATTVVAPPAVSPEISPPTAPVAAPRPFVRAAKTTDDTSPGLTARQLYERGLTHQREKRPDEALVDLTKSVELLDQGIGRWEWFTDVYFTRASLLADRKDYAGAIAAYTRMLEFEPKRYEARSNRALYYGYLKLWDAALADYAAIIDDPETDFSHNVEKRERLLAMTHEKRGSLFQDNKQYEKAIVDYTASLKWDPSSRDGMIVYWRRGWCYEALQQVDKALEDANHLSQLALEWATSSKKKDSDRDHAMTAARFGSEIFKHQRPFQLEVLAATYARAGDFFQAVSYQKRALTALSPGAAEERSAMEARLALYQTGQPLNRD